MATGSGKKELWPQLTCYSLLESTKMTKKMFELIRRQNGLLNRDKHGETTQTIKGSVSVPSSPGVPLLH